MKDSPVLSPTNVNFCAVGKLLTSKRVNVEAFRSVIKSVWKIHNVTCIEGLVIMLRPFTGGRCLGCSPPNSSFEISWPDGLSGSFYRNH